MKANTPAVIRKASIHSLAGAERFMKIWPQMSRSDASCGMAALEPMNSPEK